MNLMITIGLLLVAAGFIAYRVNFWMKEGKKLAKGGYLPPPPTFFGKLAYRLATKLGCFLVVGPVKVIGRENARYNGRLIVVPNHQFEFDFAVTTQALPYHYRQLAVASEVSGIRSAIAAWVGFCAVDGERGKAKGKAGAEAVIDAGAKILTHDKAFLMFPQGVLARDNVLRKEEFRTGWIRILNRAAESVDPGELAALPIGIIYKTDAKDATWGHRLANRINFPGVLLKLIGFAGFRVWVSKVTNPEPGQPTKIVTKNYGATVVVGKPIPLKDLPADIHEATEVLRQAIQVEVDKAKAAK
ncbi:MAG: 1-acyl-sn-glycerol-3-phosphate acyltransferase [Candidatus Melainabacteria bacterium]|jgi:1-acyl-sn-glycerol-3-phosphate acyltransferase|nr:1-acyl-sn-glycerol-3-phosphate acyltransferase [Candidatus Melainabacteria bacterium]